MKLGTKVKCKGYLKKVDTKHVALESEKADYNIDTDDINKMMAALEINHFCTNNDVIFIEDEVSQDIKQVIQCDFSGVVVAKKLVATSRWYSVVDHEYRSYSSAPGIDSGIEVAHCNYIDCYQVFFRMGGSRLVPIDMCEVI